MSLPPDPTYLTFLPIAKKIIRQGGIDTGNLRGTDYGDFIREEELSLAHLLAATTVARLEELR